MENENIMERKSMGHGVREHSLYSSFFFFFIHFVTLGAELNLRFFSKNFLVKLQGY